VRRLVPTNGAILGSQSTAILTINDNDVAPSLSITDVTIAEPASGATATTAIFTVSLSVAGTVGVSVDFSTLDGTATAGADYTAATGTLNFAPGETTKTVTVSVLGDVLAESTETFTVNLSNALGGATISDAQGVGTISDTTPTPTLATLQFGQATYSVAEGTPNLVVTVTRSSDTSGEASVDITNTGTSAEACETSSPTARQRCDFVGGLARLTFAAGETSKSFTVFITDDAFVEGAETVQLNLTNASSGASVGAQSSALLTISDNDTSASTVNPIMGVDFFVRQHYVDFLNREPDAAGFADWQNVLNTCGTNGGGLGSPATCDRVQVSSAFYRSPEFTDRGYFIYRFYDGVLGRLPLYTEFTTDLASISGAQTPAEQQEKIATFVAGFMRRQEFETKYPGLATAANAEQFIARLEVLAGVTLPETISPQRPEQPPQFMRSQLVQMMGAGQKTGAETLRSFVEQQVVYDKFFFRGFVAMQYFGYLRRDPEQAGYDDWVDVLTNGRASAGIAPGDYRHLIFGFIYSDEYSARFGQR